MAARGPRLLFLDVDGVLHSTAACQLQGAEAGDTSACFEAACMQELARVPRRLLHSPSLVVPVDRCLPARCVRIRLSRRRGALSGGLVRFWRSARCSEGVFSEERCPSARPSPGQVVERTQAEIVLSSDWRCFAGSRERLAAALEPFAALHRASAMQVVRYSSGRG